MKLSEFADVDATPEEDETKKIDRQEHGWLSRAVEMAVTDIIPLITNESEKEPEWFVSPTRASRIDRLVLIMFTAKLLEVSNGQWIEREFLGQEHSDAIDAALRTIRSRINPVFQQLRQQAMTKLASKKTEPHMRKKETQRRLDAQPTVVPSNT